MPSRALPWFESYADQDRIAKMYCRHARLTRELWWQPIRMSFMESVV